jgi:thiamine biosynthesis lipoprotein
MSIAPATRVLVRLPPDPTADESFRALGSDVRLIATGDGARAAVDRARREILDYHARLSRFDPASELCALNADPRPAAPASALLRSAVRAALWAARQSGGLVDPCLLDALERAGYVGSFERSGTVAPPSGLARPAAPHPASPWRNIHVDDDAGVIVRPPGLRLDLGGSGKGHAADLVARRFESFGRWVVDCGGDIRVGGPREVQIAHPLDDEPAARLRVEDAAVATSSVVSRAWRTTDGRRAHHLIDPRSGEPAWTGLLAATALAPTTLHAETLAKVALMRGPGGARVVLEHHGGLVVHEDGGVETFGPLPELA